MAESVIGTIAVAIKAKNEALINGLKDANKSVKDFSSNFTKDFAAISAIGAAAGAAVVFALKKSIDAAAEAQDAQNALEIAFRNAGLGSTDAAQRALEYSTQLQRLTGISDENISRVQAELVQYGITGEALKATTQAVLDLSTAKRIDLKAATDLLGKAFVGETSTLKRYGVVVDENIPATDKFRAVLLQLNSAMGGAASGRLDTFNGQMALLKENFGDLAEALGVVFLPLLTKLVVWVNRSVQETVDFIQKVGGLKNAMMLAILQVSRLALETLPVLGLAMRASARDIDAYIARVQAQMMQDKLRADAKKQQDASVAQNQTMQEQIRAQQMALIKSMEATSDVVREQDRLDKIKKAQEDADKFTSEMQKVAAERETKLRQEREKAEAEHRLALNKVFMESEQFMTTVFDENLTRREKANRAFSQTLKILQDAVVKAYIENAAKQKAAAVATSVTETAAAKPVIAANFFKAHSFLPFVGQALAIGFITAAFAFIDRLVKFNKGGVVGGVGNRDTVPALLTPGERVLTREQNRAFESGGLGGGRGTTVVFQISGTFVEGDENKWRALFNDKLLPIMERHTMMRSTGILNRRRGSRS